MMEIEAASLSYGDVGFGKVVTDRLTLRVADSGEASVRA